MKYKNGTVVRYLDKIYVVNNVVDISNENNRHLGPNWEYFLTPYEKDGEEVKAGWFYVEPAPKAGSRWWKGQQIWTVAEIHHEGFKATNGDFVGWHYREVQKFHDWNLEQLQGTIVGKLTAMGCLLSRPLDNGSVGASEKQYALIHQMETFCKKEGVPYRIDFHFPENCRRGWNIEANGWEDTEESLYFLSTSGNFYMGQGLMKDQRFGKTIWSGYQIIWIKK